MEAADVFIWRDYARIWGFKIVSVRLEEVKEGGAIEKAISQKEERTFDKISCY